MAIFRFSRRNLSKSMGSNRIQKLSMTTLDPASCHAAIPGTRRAEGKMYGQVGVIPVLDHLTAERGAVMPGHCT
jgi:hypothetical protein